MYGLKLLLRITTLLIRFLTIVAAGSFMVGIMLQSMVGDVDAFISEGWGSESIRNEYFIAANGWLFSPSASFLIAIVYLMFGIFDAIINKDMRHIKLSSLLLGVEND